MHQLLRRDIEDFLIGHGLGSRNSSGVFISLMAVAPVARTYATAEGPLVINSSSNTTITGRHFATTAGQVPLTVQGTGTVTVTKCKFSAQGTDEIIRCDGARVVFTDNEVYHTNPGGEPPYLFKGVSPRRITMENNLLSHCGGVLAAGWTGDGSNGDTLTVRYNKVLNVDGRTATGKAGLSFVNPQNLHISGGLIAWNEIVNTLGESLVEDNINFFNAGGTAASPFRVEDNLIFGGFGLLATDDHTGSGIILDGPDTTEAGSCSYVTAQRNRVVGTGNAGMNVAVGHHIIFQNNDIVCSALGPAGQALRSPYAGISHANQYNQSLSIFGAGTTISGNRVAYMRNAASGGGRKDYDQSVGLAQSLESTNTSVNPGQAVTYAQELALVDAWRTAKQTAGVVTGLLTS